MATTRTNPAPRPDTLRVAKSDEDEAQARDQAFQQAFQQQYCFSLNTTVRQRFAGETAGGHRLDLEFVGERGSLRFDGQTSLSQMAAQHLRQGQGGAQAEVRSGSDWAFLNASGVLAFDSRITLAVGKPAADGQSCLVEGRLRGRADLRRTRGPNGETLFADDVSAAAVINRWQAGFAEGSALPLILAVMFDVPIAGYDRAQTDTYEDCRELERGLLLGIGQARLGGTQHSPLSSLSLALYRLPTEMCTSLLRGSSR